MQTNDRPWAPFHHVGVVYEVDGVGGDLVHRAGRLHDWCQWFSRDKVADLLLAPFAVTLAWPD